MKTYRSNETVNPGVYLSTWPVDVRHVSAEGETLAGVPGAEYRRVPGALLLALSPVLGGVFVMAFPVMVMVGVVVGLTTLVIRAVRSAAEENAWLARVGWAPAAAYLNRHGTAATETRPDEKMAELARETAEKKADEDAHHA